MYDSTSDDVTMMEVSRIPQPADTPWTNGSVGPNYGLGKSIAAIKDAVTIERYVEDQGVQLKPFGKELRGRCIVHGGRNPQSFSVNPVEQVWHCFRCLGGGDLITLCRGVEGGEAHEAMMVLSERYGVERWERPDSWHRKRTRQQAIRDAIDGEKIEHVRRLLFRLCFVPWLRQLPEWERGEATESAWRKSLPLAKQLYDGRRT